MVRGSGEVPVLSVIKAITIIPPAIRRYIIQGFTDKDNERVEVIPYGPSASPTELAITTELLKRMGLERMEDRWVRRFVIEPRPLELAEEVAGSLDEEVFFLDGKCLPSPAAKVIGVEP